MKPRKLQITTRSPKVRKTWSINPRTRVHDDFGYNRGKEKDKLRKELNEEQG